MDRLKQLQDLGQSIWYDNIQRSLLENGVLAGMITRGAIRGITSNPSIFHNAISKTHDYDAALMPMAWAGWSSDQIFYQLAVEDIQNAADLFRPLFELSQGGDGYVSLEVNPLLANDTDRTISEAKRLWDLVNRPNLMVKIPATKAGIPAIRKSIADGINVNVTLIFSLDRYRKVMDAYISGLEDRLAKGLPIGSIASVASFFVSRVDTKVDKRLETILKNEGPDAPKARSLLGKAAIANARLAYGLFLEEFEGGRFAKLSPHGARKQRPLWASTSTKNPAYRDVLYVEDLIGPDTVNTMPPQTLEAFADHGESKVMLGPDVKADADAIRELESLGISMDDVTRELEEEGVKAFSDAFEDLIKAIEERRLAAVAELGPYSQVVPQEVARLEKENAAERIFAIDPKLWVDDPAGQDEIKKRMGWLQTPKRSRALVDTAEKLAASCQADGMTHALLLGMGGSSLAPEVLSLTFGTGKIGDVSALSLSILDSTDPTQVLAAEALAPIEKTLFIVSSKSGGTSEVMAYLDYFWAKAGQALGSKAPMHFVAITDPGTKLEKLAKERNFRAILPGDPEVGGRYSALTAFGILPAALLGIDLTRLLDKAQGMMSQCLPEVPAQRNPGLVLGALLGKAAQNGRNKVTILADAEFRAFGSWLEQLLAELTGKTGRGIVPVDIEPTISAGEYSKDRVFVYIRKSGKKDELAASLVKAGHPVLTFHLDGPYDLGAEFYRWEMATAVASAVMRLNGFDQPDVQDSKNRTAAKISAYQKTGKLDEGEPLWQGAGGRVYGVDLAGIREAKTLKEVVKAWLSAAKSGDYVAINAYVPRNAANLEKLQNLRKAFLVESGCATTLGFGPRFQHSTGQLHKGGPNIGLFLQITYQPQSDFEIPTEGISFGTLEQAQALGDLEALLAKDRRAIRVHLTGASLDDLI